MLTLTRPIARLRAILCLSAILLASGCTSTRQAPTTVSPATMGPIVAQIGDEALTLHEFERRYARSVGGRESAADDSLAQYRDFLDRYVEFRLKVKAAQEAGLDKDAGVLQEITTYRQQLARPYVLERAVLEPIARRIYERQREVVDASHILLRLDEQASPADTLAAFEKISAIRDSIVAGSDFGTMAVRHSEDPSARRPQGPGARGRLGYFSAGRMVESFEDMAYTTPVGGVSPIFRSRFGYHILTVHDRRPNPPAIRIAHIMLRPEGAAADSAAVRARIDSLRQRIAAGDDFAALARTYSHDTGSAQRGGELGVMPFDAPVVESFKEAAYAITEVGDVSPVVETPYGFHLIKLLERQPVLTFEEAYPELKRQAANLPRAIEAEQAFAREILAREGARLDTSVVLGLFEGVAADSVRRKLVARELSPEVLALPLLTIGDSTYTVNDFASFARQVEPEQGTSREALLLRLADRFATTRAISYETATLETRDDEFRLLMSEFRDGLVLFKFMEESVWDAADRDSTGLRAYFEANADAYQFPERTRVIGLHARSHELLASAAERLEAGASLADLYAELEADTTQVVRLDTMDLASPSGSVYDQALDLAAGEHTDPLSYRGGFVLLVNDGRLPAGPKSFEEARAEVATAYQSVLEQRLLEELREKYRVQTFPDRLDSAFAAEGGGPATAPRAEHTGSR